MKAYKKLNGEFPSGICTQIFEDNKYVLTCITVVYLVELCEKIQLSQTSKTHILWWLGIEEIKQECKFLSLLSPAWDL